MAQMITKEASLISWVERFYNSHPEYLQFVRRVACGKSNTISLRILDWLVTSYAKRHKVVIFHNQCAIHLHSEYKCFLASHSKKLFDAFRRRKRVHVSENGVVNQSPDEDEEPFLVSTVAQLVFFYWAYQRGIIEYAEKHVHSIEDDLRTYGAPPSPLLVHAKWRKEYKQLFILHKTNTLA